MAAPANRYQERPQNNHCLKNKSNVCSKRMFES
jgi:hypothetical protein